MTGPVLVDSNVYIGLLRRGLDPVEILGGWIGDGDLATCGMVRLEVERGLKVERIRRRVSSLFDVLINVSTTNKIWEQATSSAWSLDRVGITLPAQDILIAACAHEIGAAILSDDKHFEKFPGLRIFKPAEEIPEWSRQ
jgi:predicted nucleic acid-binding protein